MDAAEPAEIAVVILRSRDRVWIQPRRGTGHLEGYWEFPGGKLRRGESPEAAACRELKEELGLDLQPEELRQFLVQDYQYPDRWLRLHFFLSPCRTSLEGRAGRWVPAGELTAYPLPPANRAVVRRLQSLQEEEQAEEKNQSHQQEQ